jgi:DNA-binding NarL/FixJ family response regulator
MLTFKSDGAAMLQGRPFLAREEAGLAASAAPPSDIHAVCRGLTARQRDVLALLMQGKSNKAICRVLRLAEPTVKNHVSAILRVLKAANRTEAVAKVMGAWGFLPISPAA